MFDLCSSRQAIAYLLRKFLQYRVVVVTTNKGTVGLNDDAILAAVFHNGALLAVGVKLSIAQ